MVVLSCHAHHGKGVKHRGVTQVVSVPRHCHVTISRLVEVCLMHRWTPTVHMYPHQYVRFIDN
jgi:hypothetical protein